MGCLLSTGHLITSCLQESVNSRWFYAYLMGVAAQVKRSYQVPLVLIVDNASIHRSKQMVDWRKLLVQEYSTTLYFLPAYSPELNRIEMVWKQMKYNWRDFKVMKADQIERWVGQISKGFGNEYMFTFQLILKGGTHASLRQTLIELRPANKQLKAIAYRLASFHQLRIIADYKLEDKVTEISAKESIENCKKILDQLDLVTSL